MGAIWSTLVDLILVRVGLLVEVWSNGLMDLLFIIFTINLELEMLCGLSYGGFGLALNWLNKLG